MAIQSKDLDPQFKHEVAKEPGGKEVLRCFACGSCTVSCPVREINDIYNPRKIIRMVLYGMKDRVLQSDFIWLCSTCYACQDRCPQGVKITDLMTVLKNMAVKEGYIKPGFRKQAELIYNHGRLYEIEDFDNKKREKLGLPAVQKSFDKVKKLLKKSALAKAIAEKAD
jgi:heterodisulfide reductase subunit C